MKLQKMLTTLFFLLLACHYTSTSQAQTCPPLQKPTTGQTVYSNTNKRPFHMGFVNFPHTGTTECGDPRDINTHYIRNYGDLMVIYEDGGVPWSAAIKKWYDSSLKAYPTQYPPGYRNEINGIIERRNSLPTSHKVALYINYMNFMKTALADERTEDPLTASPIQTELPKESKFLFNHDYFVLGYIAHITYLIDNYRPDYIGFGIENNLMLTRIYEAAANENPQDDIPYQAWVDYNKAMKRIYTYLKLAYPNRPFYFSISIDDYNDDRTFDFGLNINTYNLLLAAIDHTKSTALYSRSISSTLWQREHLKLLIQFSDVVAVSAYPFMGHYADPSLIPLDFFTKIREIAPTKPYAIAETGFIAESVIYPDAYVLYPEGKLDIPGSFASQGKYMNRLLTEATKQNALWVNWFIARDYDMMWPTLAKGKNSLINRLWRDVGIFDGAGNLRTFQQPAPNSLIVGAGFHWLMYLWKGVQR